MEWLRLRRENWLQCVNCALLAGESGSGFFYKIQFNWVRQINISRNGEGTTCRICTKTLGESFFVRGRLS